jgi:hypothetical protein
MDKDSPKSGQGFENILWPCRKKTNNFIVDRKTGNVWKTEILNRKNELFPSLKVPLYVPSAYFYNNFSEYNLDFTTLSHSEKPISSCLFELLALDDQVTIKTQV